jgi:hypothetical protein
MSGQGKTSKLRIHEFRHRGNTYEVCLEELDGQSFAAVYAPNGDKRPLVPFPDEIPEGLSSPAIKTHGDEVGAEKAPPSRPQM